MSEFIAHEIQVSSATGSKGEQTDHFMQGNPPLNDQVIAPEVHALIHFLVQKPEYDRFVSHQRLVM